MNAGDAVSRPGTRLSDVRKSARRFIRRELGVLSRKSRRASDGDGQTEPRTRERTPANERGAALAGWRGLLMVQVKGADTVAQPGQGERG